MWTSPESCEFWLSPDYSLEHLFAFVNSWFYIFLVTVWTAQINSGQRKGSRHMCTSILFCFMRRKLQGQHRSSPQFINPSENTLLRMAKMLRAIPKPFEHETQPFAANHFHWIHPCCLPHNRYDLPLNHPLGTIQAYVLTAFQFHPYKNTGNHKVSYYQLEPLHLFRGEMHRTGVASEGPLLEVVVYLIGEGL